MKTRFCAATLLLASLSAAAYTTTESETLKVWFDFPTVIADGKTVNYVTVYEHDDSGINYSAFNMEFILPDGFSVNKIKQGRDMVNDIFLSARAASTHSIACNLYQGNDLRIIADSSMNDDLYPDDEDGNPLDELFTVGLIADPSIPQGGYEIRLEGIKFVIRDGNACIPADEPIIMTVHIESPTSGIEEVEADEIDPDDCYDISGKKVDPSKVHGVIIVTKGRKVLVK